MFAGTGILLGVLTGLIPGIHPNTLIFTAVPFYLGGSFDTILFVALLTGMSVSHTFHDFLPAFFISAPDAESALSSINASKMVQRGKGLEAFYYTVYGATTSIIPVLIVSGASLLFLENLYQYLSGIMGYVLIFFLLFIVFDSNDILYSGLLVAFAGALGVVSFQSPVNQNFVFIPLFSGLFAVPAILSSLRSEYEIPEQAEPQISLENAFRGSLGGTVSGFLAGVVPGVGAAVSTSFVSPLMDRSRGKFLSAMGAVNTTDIIFSIVALYLLDRSRSGVTVALEIIGSELNLVFVAFLALCCTLVSAFVALRVSKYYINFIRVFSPTRLLVLVLLFITGVVFLMTGLPGLVVLLTASCVGEVALRVGNRKACMAVLIVPAILFFMNITIFM